MRSCPVKTAKRGYKKGEGIENFVKDDTLRSEANFSSHLQKGEEIAHFAKQT
jgi:hypothetical protein